MDEGNSREKKPWPTWKEFLQMVKEYHFPQGIKDFHYPPRDVWKQEIPWYSGFGGESSSVMMQTSIKERIPNDLTILAREYVMCPVLTAGTNPPAPFHPHLRLGRACSTKQI